MSRRIVTQVEIAAPPARVWSVLTAWEAYPEWNPFIREITGAQAEGSRLSVLFQFAEGRTARFRPKLRSFKPGKELIWLGHLFVPGLFDGEHAFHLEELAGDRTLFIQRESFHGFLVPFLWRAIKRPTRRGFMLMNAALKGRIEQYSAGDRDA